MPAAPNQMLKVALVQIRPKPLDSEHNFANAAAKIREAAAQGATLAVLPEYHLTGWVPEDLSFALAPEVALQFRSRYQALAAELHINLCTGTVVSHAESPGWREKNKPTLLNRSDFIDHNGDILGTYTKTNLWIPERKTLTSSVEYARETSQHGMGGPSPHKLINTPLGPIGVLVCWDLAFPEAFRQLILAGAKMIIIPSYWTSLDMSHEGLAYNKDCEKMFVENTLVTRAFENTAAILFCNAGGPKEDGFFGCSQAVLPIVGKVPGSFTDGEEGMRVLDIDMRTVDVAEENYQVRNDLARDDWHYGY